MDADATERSGSGMSPARSTIMPNAQDSATFMKHELYANRANFPQRCTPHPSLLADSGRQAVYRLSLNALTRLREARLSMAEFER